MTEWIGALEIEDCTFPEGGVPLRLGLGGPIIGTVTSYDPLTGTAIGEVENPTTNQLVTAGILKGINVAHD